MWPRSSPNCCSNTPRASRFHSCVRRSTSPASTRCRSSTSSTPAGSLGDEVICGWRGRDCLPSTERRHAPEPTLLGVLEVALEISRSLRHAHVVRDHLGELLGVGEEPAVRSVDDRSLDTGADERRLKRLTRKDPVPSPPKNGNGKAAIAKHLNSAR